MSNIVDLNSDIGESFGAYKMGMDEEIMKYISSANIACGYHAGDPMVMESTIKIAKKLNVAIGSHPGFPDLMGFGRRAMSVTPKEASNYILYQTGALVAFAKIYNLKLQHIKMHGGLYNIACSDEKLATNIVQTILKYDENIILLALSKSIIVDIAKQNGLRVAQEVFADRGYNEDGTLVNRNLPNAFITDEDEAISRVKKMITKGKVMASNGKEVDIKADSICVHGDGKKAILFAKTIKDGLLKDGIEISPLGKWIN